MKNVLVVILLLYSCKSIAQQGFIKSYNFGYPTAVRFNAMLIDELELIICGYARDSVPPYQTGAFLAKLDTMGEVLSFSVNYDSQGRSFIPITASSSKSTNTAAQTL